MDRWSSFLGTELLAELTASDGMSKQEGIAWIRQKAGRSYDPGAMYRLTWPGDEDLKQWADYHDLRVQLLSDSELIVMELDYRKQHRLPPRRPWEPYMFASAMGRSGR